MRIKLTYLHHFGVRHGLEGHSVDLHQDISLLKISTPPSIQDLLHLLAVCRVGDGKAEPGVSLRYGDGQEPGLRRWPRDVICGGGKQDDKGKPWWW